MGKWVINGNLENGEIPAITDIDLIAGTVTRNGKISTFRKKDQKIMTQAAAVKLGRKVSELSPEERFLIEERKKNHEYLYGKGKGARYSEEMQMIKSMLDF